MHGFLPTCQFRTLEKLVQGIYLLIGAQYSAAELNTATQLLYEFGMEYRQQYGKNSVTMNIHLMQHHIAQSCSSFGPLWGFWCYPYENMLGYNKRFVHGTRRPEKSFIFGCQIMRIMRYLEDIELPTLIAKGEDPKVKQVYKYNV